MVINLGTTLGISLVEEKDNGLQTGISTSTTYTNESVAFDPFIYREAYKDSRIKSDKVKITDIQGNTTQINQLVKNGDFSNGTTSWAARYGTMSVSNGVCTYTITTANASARIDQSLNIVGSHKYYLAFWGLCSKATRFVIGLQNTPGYSISVENTANVWTKCVGILTAAANGAMLYCYCNQSSTLTVNDTCQYRDVVVIDLTAMFGAGNEPATVEAFEAAYFQKYGHPLTYEPYNEGSLVNVKSTAFKTTGFNQWDEQWENGKYDNTTGQETTGNNVRTKNYVPILPNTSYCEYNGSGQKANIYFYDASKNYISYTNPTLVNNIVTFTTPANAAFLRFYVATGYGNTYKNDICINSSDAAFNGTYEPYTTSQVAIPITTLEGKLNGEGDAVVVAADGINGVSDIADCIDYGAGITKLTKNLKKISGADIESVVYGVSAANANGYSRVILNPQDKANGYKLLSNLFTTIYIVVSADASAEAISGISSSSHIYISILTSKLSGDLTTADGRKAAFVSWAIANNLEIVYQLATPLVYEVTNLKLPVSFLSNQYGTWQVLPENTAGSTPTTTGPALTMVFKWKE